LKTTDTDDQHSSAVISLLDCPFLFTLAGIFSRMSPGEMARASEIMRDATKKLREWNTGIDAMKPQTKKGNQQ
jgi:hypothetical protein